MEQKYLLGKYTRVLLRQDDAIFGAGSKQHVFTDRAYWENLVLAASQWTEEKTAAEAYAHVSERMSKKEFDSAFDFLRTNNFIMPAETSGNIFLSRYSRNHLHYQSYGVDPESVQNKLSEKKVLILGCGGIGNHVSAIMATSGVGEIILVDNDEVEMTNLTRQIMFTERDIGCPKTTVLMRELKERNSNIAISEIKMTIRDISDISQLPEADIWVISADEPYYLVPWINEWCVKNGQAYINAGYVNDIAVFGPLFIPGKTGCYACHSSVGDLPEMKDKKIQDACRAINNNFKVATFPPVNALSAALCANDVLKFLGGYGQPLSVNRRIGIWSDRLFTEERTLEKNTQCAICGKLS